ncbi:Uncharacterised protein [Escherichia coli]|nr:Uncharacterised protein [Escherichia coli]CAD5715113.1 Uncharacterised protein [Escherichia coli]CAD5866945.1 Uncharacterised protein [Escherichia coli]
MVWQQMMVEKSRLVPEARLQQVVITLMGCGQVIVIQLFRVKTYLYTHRATVQIQ